MKKMNETKVVCPKCGAQFAIAEKTHVATGVVIGKDAGIGTIHPQVVGQDKPESKLPSKAADRIEALRAAGVDVSGFFAMTGANGGESVAALKEGKLTILSDDDPVYDYILEKGEVYNSKLAPRWVMSQMFHMLAREKGTESLRGCMSITAQIRLKGYEYMWKQLEDSLYAQYRQWSHGDRDNYIDRNRWFNKELVLAMMKDYSRQVEHYIERLKAHRCKGVPYKVIFGENVFVEDIQKKVLAPLENVMKRVQNASNTWKLFEAVRDFNKDYRKNRGWNPKQCSEWIDAYKGAGAFFTMQNLIRFHGCRFGCLGKDESYRELVRMANEYAGEGWRMIGVLRKFLKDNNIDIEKKMAEWRKRK